MTPNEQPNVYQPPIPQMPYIPPVAPKIKEKRVYSLAERVLLPLALAVAILFDRLVFASLFRSNFNHFTMFFGVFWLCYLVIFYSFYWQRLKRNRVLWYVAGCSAALCLWSFFYMPDSYSNDDFASLSYLVIPAVLMAHAQFFAGEYKLKDTFQIAVAWLLGWVVRPFSGIMHLFGAAGSLISGGNKPVVRKVAVGVTVTLPLLCILLPLLSGADLMFGYHIERIAGQWKIESFAGHMIVVIIAFMLFYSFLWNAGFCEKDKAITKITMQIDTVISCIVLGTVTLLYILFCAVQFTYLFAGAGLPEGMTYSEYAREGFAQTVTVCAINLAIFGIFLAHGKRVRMVSGLLAALLTLTGVMLVSGSMRLWLYIDAYGLTWLRLLSAWFVIYLFAVVILSGVRMVKEKLPVVAVCAMILLGWFVVLGYSNPDALIYG